MIARQDTFTDKTDVWARLSAPLPTGVISWRQDGKPIHRDGKYFSRFVCYIEANTVRERLDAVVPGEWDLTYELLPPMTGGDDTETTCAFKARLQILGVIREDVGTGRDYKQAATDAFKRAAVRFGIGHELYAYEQNWIEMDGDGRSARPLEDPQHAYERRYGSGAQKLPTGRTAPAIETVVTTTAATVDTVSCPKCGGRMWDNRLTKRNPKAPDFKCRDRNCDGVVWPARQSQPAAAGHAETAHESAGPLVNTDAEPGGSPTATLTDDELPF